jgi:sortase A
MRDRRPVDELSIEELEQILRIKKREARQARLQRLEDAGRRRGDIPVSEAADAPPRDTRSERPIIPHESFVEAGRRARRTRRDRLLLAVEAVAAVGLVAVLVYTMWTLRGLNRASAEQQAEAVAALPDATPTALITAVVLPGGHTPPTDPGGAQPNYNEVPAHLRPLVEQQIAGPALVPTAGPAGAVRLRIPAIGVDAPVVQGDGWEQLKKGAGQHIGSANPGEDGNLVLSAHNDIYGEIFRNLDRLQVGDEIIISTQLEDFVYKVVDTRIVAPTQVEVMDQTREPIVTLISCYPYMVNTDRIVVIAELVE